MIFRVRSVTAHSKVLFFVKPHLSSFTLTKNVLNVRFLHDVGTENDLPKSTSVSWYHLRRQFSETLYFKSVMENNPKYPDLIFREEILKENENSENKLVIFLRNAVDNKISQKNDSDNYELRTDLVNIEGDKYTIHDFMEVFHLLPKYFELYPKPENSELRQLFSMMTKKIREVKKTKEDIRSIITLLNLIKDIHVPGSLAFDFISFIYNRFKKLTNVQLVEYFYVLHYFRIFYGKESKYAFEMFITKALPELNPDEVAVISYAFFRSQLRPGSLVAEAISTRLAAEIENLNDLQACTIFKCLQFSGRRSISNTLMEIYDKCVPVLDRYTIMTKIHIISAGVSVNIEHKELFQHVWDQATEKFDELRMKDIERLLLTSLYTNFPVTENSQLVQLIKEKFGKDKIEAMQHPLSFLSLVTFLIMHDIYFEDLIKYGLSVEYRQTVKERREAKLRENALFIEESVALERPEYELTLMPAKQRRVVSRIIPPKDELESSSARCNKRILCALKTMYNEESVTYFKPLLHYVTIHPILCINRINEPQSIGDKLERSEEYTSVKAPEDGNLWIAFILLRWQGCLKDKLTPNLVTEAKLRQFRAAGYIPVTAHNFLLSNKSDQELQQFLSEAIKDKIKSQCN